MALEQTTKLPLVPAGPAFNSLVHKFVVLWLSQTLVLSTSLTRHFAWLVRFLASLQLLQFESERRIFTD